MFIIQLLKCLKILTVAAFWYLWNPRPIFYRKLLHRLRQENILFTKIFQSLSNTTSFDLNTELRTELRPYTSNASYTEDEINYDIIDAVETEYGVCIDRHVANSGMIALIFYGTDTSGTPVVLKLKRANISERLRVGCEDIGRFYTWASYWFPRNIVIRALRPFFLNLDDIIEQCNFNHEIAHMTEAREDYAELRFVHIPQARNTPTDSDSDTENDTEYILMDRIEGSHLLHPDIAEETRLDLLYKFCLFSSFGYVSNAIQHIDLHPGNVLFMPNGDIGIIDFGLAFRFTDDEHDILLSLGELMRGTNRLEDIDIIDVFKNIFYPPLRSEDITNHEEFADICRSILQPILDYIDTNELSLLDCLDRLSTMMNRDITMVPHFYKTILGMMCMGQLYSIMGRIYENRELLRSIEIRALNNAFLMVIQ